MTTTNRDLGTPLKVLLLNLATLAVGASITAGCITHAPYRAHAVTVHAVCATAAVVGLQWEDPNSRSDITAYRVARDGNVLGTVKESSFVDQTVGPSTTYRYDVTVLYGRDSEMAIEPLNVTTAAASLGPDAPYCSSSLIHFATWDWADGYHAAEGSDLWPVTWGKDGNVYAFFGDGGGFGGDNSRGRASFGVAKIAGGPPPSPLRESNIYGGFNTLYPSAVSGKIGSIIAVGSDFYGIGGIYRPSELKSHEHGPVSGIPSHVEIVYSKHDAHSWQDAAWTFCSTDPDGHADTSGGFCPVGFVNFGRANTGAPGRYVYLLGTSAAETHRSRADFAANTYLARVPEHSLLVQSAYRYFTGLDQRGEPVWGTDTQHMAAVFSDRNSSQSGCGSVCNMAATLLEAVYDEGLQRFIGVAQAEHAAQTALYEAPNLWGPWKTISYNNIDPHTGNGGWGRLGTAAGESLGVHIVNAWTSTDGLSLWMVYSSNGTAPEQAQFPPPGSVMDSFNLIRVRLQ